MFSLDLFISLRKTETQTLVIRRFFGKTEAFPGDFEKFIHQVLVSF